MPVVQFPWEGPLTYVRQSVTRGSAAGASYAGVNLHRLVGLGTKGEDIAGCGLVFKSGTVRTTKQGDLQLCRREGCF